MRDDFDFLKNLCARAAGVRVADLECPTRGHAHVAFARQLLCYLANTMLNLNYATVGALVGRDRATIRHACATIEDRRDDGAFDMFVTSVEDAVRSAEAAASLRPCEMVPPTRSRRGRPSTEARA
ncbi:helix-turn-helix domain-containing protein [Acuticoccus mangrovi]|uniref:Chromosomal replication initiator DnaA n=1 Tax=Acuticoccus mangrovi TaxID=2796142 RepID=A0A934IK14_9HYPH|nr:helix-turn-helix domain-containing protein [Acuticoccus mangrovi]MBJ3776416.1 chromosomal replication initiator DnaA [Acuticoccus mangrovi]